jgi:hypothetical protein
MKYYFRTDAEAPKRLDPWVLASMPTEGEQHYFADDGMRLVFGTNNVVRLFEAYNKRLQIRLKASSFRAVPDLPNAPHPLVLVQDANLPDASVQPVADSVLSPFEEALEDLFENKLNPSCVPVNHSRKKHSKVDIKSPLDLFTDYVLDVEMLDKNAPESAVGTSIWRRSFSTGAFRSVQEFARSFFTARVEHKFVAPNVLQAIGTDFAGKDPVGNELDQRLIDAGLEPPEVPNRPRLVIYWEQPAGSPPSPPQPAALIIDSSEPLWRHRRLPVSVPDDTVPAAKRWELTDVPWLEPDEHTPGNPVADQIVDQIVKAPGGQRALVTFKSDSRGKKLRLALRQIKHTEPYMDGPGNPNPDYHIIADTILDRAPWEETD